jgi:hypothetical protein
MLAGVASRLWLIEASAEWVIAVQTELSVAALLTTGWGVAICGVGITAEDKRAEVTLRHMDMG